MAGLMYFGNRNRMTWVKCPDTGMGMSRAHWGTDGTYINGGGYVRSSTAGHVVYEMGWNFLNRAQLHAITDYRDGLYGPGNIYFLDPFQMDRNVLPQNWAHPALAAEDGQPLTDQRPTVQALMTETTNYHPDPRGTAVGGLWGYQTGTGETAATSLMTATSPKRTNLVTNPRAIGRSWGKAGSTGTEDRVLTGGPLGLGYQRYQPSTATTTSPITLAPMNSGAAAAVVVPGRTYTFSAYGRALGQSASTSIDIAVNWYTSAGANLSNESTYRYTNTSAWVRYSKTLVAPEGAAYALATMRFSITPASFVVAGEFGVDHFQIEEALDAGPAFDGDTLDADGVLYDWTGPANASTSTATFNDGPLMPDGSRIGTYIRRTVTAAKTGGSSGPFCRTPANTLAIVPGDTVTPTMYVRFSVEVTLTVQSSVRSGSGLVTSTITTRTVPAYTWTRVGQPVTATAAGDNTQVWATLTPTTVLPTGTTIDTTAGQSELGAMTPYFDGSMTSTTKSTYFWLGATNNSASLRRTTTNPLRALNAPTQSATYTLTAATQFKSVWVPVPDGYTFYVGGLYARTGTANVKVVTDAETTVNLVPDMNPAVHVIPSTAISNTGGGVTLSLTGVGTITLVGLMAQVLPNGRVPTLNTFASGQGTSGSKFAGDPTVTGYSAVRDHLSLGVTLKEVGAWDE